MSSNISNIKEMKKKVHLSLDEDLLNDFRNLHTGSLSSFIDGVILSYNISIKEKIRKDGY